MSNIVPYNEMEKMALATAKSGLFNVKNENQALTLMMIAQAENIHPIQAMQMYSIINGLPSLKSTEVQSRFQRSGGTIKWVSTDNKKAVCELSHPQGGTYTSEFGIDDAKLMGLLDKDNYKRMPKQMFMARAITMGVRAIYPQCLNNMYSSDEVQDFTDTSVEIARDDTPFVEVEVKEEVPTLKSEIAILKFKLRDMQLGEGDIKAFAKMFDLQNNLDMIIALNSDEALLIEKIKQFENGAE
jgi:hypothetical protein